MKHERKSLFDALPRPVRKWLQRWHAFRAWRCTWFEWPRGRHSEKPDAFYDLVERCSPAPFLEMFARRARLGWDSYGNESLGHVEIAS